MTALSQRNDQPQGLESLKITNGQICQPAINRNAKDINDMEHRPFSAQTFPTRSSKNPYFTRNNPHPSRVRHMKGLLDLPICVVESCSETESSALRLPTLFQDTRKSNKAFKLPVNLSAYKPREKAVPTIGLVPLTEDWRDQLRRIALAAGLPLGSFNPVGFNSNRDVVSRQQSRGGMRNPMKEAEEEFVRNVTTRDGNRPSTTPQTIRLPSRGSERPVTQASLSNKKDDVVQERTDALQALSSFDRALEHIAAAPDSESYIFQMLGKILQTDSTDAIRNWLVSAPEREKDVVVQMIQAVTTAEELETQALNGITPRSMHEPIYEDQLLQYESSIDVDEIKSYNEKENRRKEQGSKKLNETGNNSGIGSKVDYWKRPGTGPSNQNSQLYEWSVNSLFNKPSTPFKIHENAENEARETEIEEIRSKLASSHNVRVFSHQDGRKKTPLTSERPRTNKSSQSVRKKPPSAQGTIKTVAPFSPIE